MSRMRLFKNRSVSRPRPLALLLIGLSIALGSSLAAANADPAATVPASTTAWCVTRLDGSRACFHSLLTCILAGIANVGPCTRTDLEPPAATDVRQRPPAPPRRAPAPAHNHSLTAAQQEKLFRDFVKWSDRSEGNSH
jgi:hypothetical protein